MDCRNNPNLCDANAECVNSGLKIQGSWYYWTCACKQGYIGNGVTCVDAETNMQTLEPTKSVELGAIITTDFVEVPASDDLETELNSVPQVDLFDEMTEMLLDGTPCTGCTETIATCNA